MDWQALGLAATIFIRVFNNAGVPEADLVAARGEARRRVDHQRAVHLRPGEEGVGQPLQRAVRLAERELPDRSRQE